MEHRLYLPGNSLDRVQRGVLTKFSVLSQQYGTFIGGFDWQIYGCCTYRSRKRSHELDHSFQCFIKGLSRYIKRPVAYLAVLERRWSGLGRPEILPHWHFVAAAPPPHTTTLLPNARDIWRAHYGDAKIERYDKDEWAAHYNAKLAGTNDFHYLFDNLHRLTYTGPADLFEHFRSDPYVPSHAKAMTHGETLVVRPYGRSRRSSPRIGDFTP